MTLLRGLIYSAHPRGGIIRLPRLYRDARIGEVPRWVLGDPRELMRIPDGMLNAPVFVCVDYNGQYRMAGTAFLFGLRPGHTYLVTARHCVQKAEAYGGLYVRLNRKDGGDSEQIQLTGPWYYPESEADDVAVMPFPFLYAGLDLPFDVWPIEIPVWAATDEIVQGEGIGVGDEVTAIGLFTHRDGKHRNVPIVRSGIISAMPGEPLEDPGSGLEYEAYLVEIRSIGGLSGSPVYVVFPVGRYHHGTFEATRGSIYLIGLVRGHWPKKSEEFADFGESEVEQLNTGIAIVTPIQKAVDVIMNTEDLVKERKENEKLLAAAKAPIEDVATPSEGADTSSEF